MRGSNESLRRFLNVDGTLIGTFRNVKSVKKSYRNLYEIFNLCGKGLVDCLPIEIKILENVNNLESSMELFN